MSFIQPSDFQRKVLAIPEVWSVALLGGRAGGKTHGACQRATRHLAKYGSHAKVLIVRETYKGLLAVEEIMLALLEQAFPGKVRFNRAEHIIRIADGGTCELGQIESYRDVTKYLGREATLLYIDEAGQLREWRYVNLLKSNLRSAHGVPLSTIITGNPGGPQHQTLKKLFLPHTPWRPFEVEGETWVLAPSTMDDNPHLNHADYKRRIEASTQDAGLRCAWLNNDWNIDAGIYFPEFSEQHHILPAKLAFEITRRWAPFVAMDHGVSAPCVSLFMGRCPGDVPGIPTGSVVVFDEYSTHDPEDLNSGLRYPPGIIAEEILERCKFWNMPASGVADDAMGIGGPDDTLLRMYREDFGIYFDKPQAKNRIGGWSAIKGLLTNVTERNGKPGLFISERCQYLLQTIGLVARDPRRPEDLLTTGPDHALDALRYGLAWRPWVPPAQQRFTTVY
jgi:hypothetical protein